MKLRVVTAIIAICIAATEAFPKGKSGPWNPDVTVGDECLRQSFAVKHPHAVPSRVFNGFQGGAYFLIRFFQIFISPQDGPNCRFRPTCSAYGRQAVEMHGALLGSILIGDRLLRCNPFSAPGDDPVPKKVFTGR